MSNEQTLLSTNAAGDWLHEAIPGESAAYWRTSLANNRKPDRKPPHRVPFSIIGRGAFYSISDLIEFAEFEKSRRMGQMKLTGRAAEVIRAFGIGSGGGTTGRNLKVTGITPQIDEASGKPFIQFITDDPLMVYRLELDEAKRIAKELLEASDLGERVAK